MQSRTYTESSPVARLLSQKRAIQLSPDIAQARFLLGGLLVETPQIRAEGLRHLEYAARTVPEAKQMLKALKKD